MRREVSKSATQASLHRSMGNPSNGEGNWGNCAELGVRGKNWNLTLCGRRNYV